MTNIFNLSINILFLYLIVLNFFLAFFILFRNPKKPINQSFSLLCFTLSVWILSIYASQKFETQSLIWQKLSFFSQIIIILDAWYLSFIYPKKEGLLKNAALVFATSYFLCFTFLLFFTPFWLNKQGDYGNIYLLFIAISWIPIAWTFLNFYHKLSQTIGLQKVQLKYIFVSYFLWTLCASFFIPLFNLKTNFMAQFAFAGLASLIFSASVFYTIARYRLLDIRFLVAKAIVYGLLTIIITISYVFILFITGIYFFQAQLTNINLLTTLSLTILVSLTILPIKKALEKITNRAILKDKLLQNRSLSEFSDLFFSVASLQELTKKVCLKIKNVFKLESTYFILVQNQKIKVYPTNSNCPIDLKDVKNILDSKTNVLIFDDLKEERVKNILRKIKTYYVYYNTKGNYSGIFLLGYKLNGDLYFDDERNFLKILLSQFYVTLDKMLVFEKIKDFNKTLEIKVKKATKSLTNSNLELKNTLKLKNEIISIISHELIVPMVAISGSLTTILEGLTGKLTAKTKDFLKAVYNENSRLIRLTRNLLNISDIKTGRLKYVIENFNPKNLVEEVTTMLKPLAEEKQISLKTSISDSETRVAADYDKLKEVLINLVDNSIKYSKEGKIEIGFLPENGKMKFFVKDNGPGISLKKQKTIFSDLDLLDKRKKLTKKGRGMGLYICQNLIKGMNGVLEINSKPNKGTQINIWLPKV